MVIRKTRGEKKENRKVGKKDNKNKWKILARLSKGRKKGARRKKKENWGWEQKKKGKNIERK